MNRKSIRTENKLARALCPQRPWWSTPAAFLTTLLALPVNAVTIPNEPLATGIRVAPNILFILDDSGSMGWENINNGSIAKITGVGGFDDGPSKNGVGDGNSGDLTDDTGNAVMYEQTYITNTMYYNPWTNYRPWMTASGSRVTGGDTYASAYNNANSVSYTDSLTGASTTSNTTNLSNSTRTFYVPKSASSTDTTYLSNVENYYRFQILAANGEIYRAIWSNQPPPPIVVDASFNGTGLQAQVRKVCGNKNCNKYDYNGAWANTDGSLGTNEDSTAPVGSYFTITIPAGQAALTITTSGSDADADLYVKRGSAPSTGSYDCRGNGGSSNETCTITNPAAGTWYVAVRSADTSNADFSNVVINASYSLNPDAAMGCSNTLSGYDWRQCARITPSGAVADAVAEAKEKTNFAIWYSYYRTRIKAAKGGAAEAFHSQGRKVRVGYRTIWDRSNFDIPVKDGNDGRFVNGRLADGDAAATTSRSIWYNRLFAASANNGTPLQTALDGAGQYFQGAADTGPYGPEAGSAQFSCRQNFTILTTDGYWNTSVVNTGSDGDGSNGSIITNGLPTTDEKYKVYQYKQPAPYKDGYPNTLADVAMKYWKTDLRTDLDNNVPSSYSKVAAENDQVGRDPAFWQHMVTFTISIGLKTSSGLSSVSQVTPSTTWPDPDSSSCTNWSCPDRAARLDDLLHAAVNGRGTFVSAASPQAFADGLSAALAKINEITGSFSNATPSDPVSVNAGNKLIKAAYVSGLWTGTVTAESVVDGSSVWTASIPAFSTRTDKVFTFNGSAGASFPTSTQITALDKSGVGAASYEVSGTENADYIKGKQTLEGSGPGQLRPRTTLLGDIVNSSPAYVDETSTVYVGANDGMLHAFSASDGTELFAYVPSIVNFGNLKNLSAGDYTHQWFVDGPVVVSRRAVGPGGNTNILVGTLGRGGKGLYALDVTNPAAFGTTNVKWERSETPDNNMGQVLSTPLLAGVRNGGSTTPAVVFGNGINSSSGKAALVVLNMSTGAVIKEIATDSTTNNGLFAPTGLYAADGKTLVYVYAGDLQGNIWKFDMTSSNPGSWSASKVFHAEKTAGTPQPITGGLATAVDPRTNTRWVFFGTGSYLTAADGNDKSVGAQSMYGVMDTGTAYDRTNLTARSVSDDISGERYFGAMDSLPSSSKGWYVDLTGEGERIVQGAQIDGSFLVTASMMPSGNSCDDVGGSGYINAITPFPGIASGRSYFNLDGDGETDDTGTAGKPTGSVKTNGMPTLPVLLPGQVIINTSNGATLKFTKGQALWNRVSWREIRSD